MLSNWYRSQVSPSLATVSLNGQTELRCMTSPSTADGPHSITWYKDGRTMAGRAQRDVLRLASVSRSDCGIYQCLVRRSDGETAQSSATVRLGGKWRLFIAVPTIIVFVDNAIRARTINTSFSCFRYCDCSSVRNRCRRVARIKSNSKTRISQTHLQVKSYRFRHRFESSAIRRWRICKISAYNISSSFRNIQLCQQLHKRDELTIFFADFPPSPHRFYVTYIE